MGLPQVALGGVVVLVARGRGGPTLVLSGAPARFIVAGIALLPVVGPVTVYFFCVAALAVAAAMEAKAVEATAIRSTAVAAPAMEPTAVPPSAQARSRPGLPGDSGP